MDNDFSYTRKGELYSLQKLTFPRLKATFDYKTPLPRLIDIEIMDECQAEEIARALEKLDIYMKSIHSLLK